MIEQISDGDIEEAKKVRDAHIVRPLNRATALESLAFCIVSQGTTFETATKVIRDFRNESYVRGQMEFDELGNPLTYTPAEFFEDIDRVDNAVRESGWRFHHADRFGEALTYFTSLEGNWWNEIITAGPIKRQKHTSDKSSYNLKGLGMKTFSFWHLCMGGKNLMTLDVHVTGKLHELGIDVPMGYHIPVKRKPVPSKVQDKNNDSRQLAFDFGESLEMHEEGINYDKPQIVRHTPSDVDYVRIEHEAIELFSNDERFLYNGKVDTSLVTSALWGMGASAARRKTADTFYGNFWNNALPYSKVLHGPRE